jgi:TRAP-type C4-dicarboxylate transport system substrate-binding protein
MERRRKVVFVVLMAAILLLSMTLSSKEVVYAKPIILKLANYHNEQHPLTGEEGAFGYFRKRVEELTKGNVKVKIYCNESLLKAREQVDGVRKGIADISWSGYALDNRLVLLGVSELPFYYSSDKVLYESLKATQSIWEKGLSDLNLKVLSVFNGGFYQMYSKKPIKTLQDLKGLRIKAAGGLLTKAIEHLGAAPITLSMPEMYTAVQRGTLDAAFNIPTSIISFHMYELCKHLVKVDSWNVGIAVFIKKDFFDGLPKEIQNQVMEAARDTERFALSRISVIDAEAMNSLRAKGMELYVLPGAERSRWKSATKPVVETWLDRSGEPGKRMLEIIDRVIDKHEK